MSSHCRENACVEEEFVCVCVCVGVKERGRERKRKIERECVCVCVKGEEEKWYFDDFVRVTYCDIIILDKKYSFPTG